MPDLITKPGLVYDMEADTYLADPVKGGSLSHSGVKTIITKTPAVFAYERLNGRPNKRTFDFGHAAHQLILGAGPDIVAVDVENWRTKAAQEQAAEIRERGAVPVLAAEFEVVTAMAAAIKAHPVASKLLEPGSGQPEVSAFAQDPDTGVWLRCRYDWLRPAVADGSLLLVDYKTTIDASDEAFSKSAANYGYHIQDPFYCNVARLLGLADDITFVFVAQEKTPPYQVNVVQLDVVARQIGERQMRDAIATYKHCAETGQWPSYDNKVSLVSLPAWYEHIHEMDMVV